MVDEPSLWRARVIAAGGAGSGAASTMRGPMGRKGTISISSGRDAMADSARNDGSSR
jgi:hypothetical protein